MLSKNEEECEWECGMGMWNVNHQEIIEICERMEGVRGKIVQTVGIKKENERSDEWNEWKGV